MGLLIGLIRKKFLIQQKSNASWKLMLIAQSIAGAQKAANNLIQVGTDYKADSKVAKLLQQRQYEMKALEDKLTQQKGTLELQISEYDAEIKSCDEMIQKNAENLFSYKAA